MDKGIIGVVDAHMQTVITGACFEEHQIARQQFILIDFRSHFRLFTR